MAIKSVRETFGIRLKELRIQKKLSQKEFAEALNVHVSYVHQMESGKVAFRAESLEKIARILEVYPYELIRPSELETSLQKPSELMNGFVNIIKDYESKMDYILESINHLYSELETLNHKVEEFNFAKEEEDSIEPSSTNKNSERNILLS